MNGGTVRTRIEGRLGRITLDRPEALNALSLGMIEAIDRTLLEWQDDAAVGCVLVEGAGPRGLCAGGDIRAMRQAVLDGTPEWVDAYLGSEYVMNARIGAYPKPYVAFMDGITMGGGVGISGHGSVRIVTERTRMAMPEVGIGLLPDVGGTWLLSRGPGRLGLHVALTGDSLTAFDAIAGGLADHHVASDRLPDVATALRDCGDMGAVRVVVEEFATAPARTGAISPDAAWIDECYGFDTPVAIVAALRAHADPSAQAAATRIEAACPMSVWVTLEALRRAPELGSLGACLDQERRLAAGLARRPDFAEGVRAAVVDKDRTPRWTPRTLADIDAAELDALLA